jgi:hypothetical protein
MRSHVIVASLAFAAGALVVWLAVFANRAHVTEPPPLEPARNTVADVLSAADASASAPPATGSDVSAAPAVPPDALRQAKAERRTTCVLGGYVRSSEESPHPVAHAYVGLFRPAVTNDGPTSQFGQFGNPPEYHAEWRQLLTYAYSDDDGRFSFDELKAGTYIVHVEYGPLVTASTAPQTLEPGEVRGGLDVALPLAGSLEGHILGPPDTVFDTWRVELQPVDRRQMHAMSIEGRDDNHIQKSVRDDGSFELGPAEPGLHRVLLVWPARHSRFAQDVGLPIGEVMIVAGQTVQQTFDLRDGFPGSVNVTLHIPSLDSEYVQIHQTRTLYMITATPNFRGAKVDVVEATCLKDETVTVGPLEPGSWSLSVRSLIEEWTWKSPIEQRIEAGQEYDTSIDVHLYPGTLTCLDSVTGGPLADAEVMVWSGDSGAGANTDAEGKVHLQYPPGTYKVGTFAAVDGRFDDGAFETFEWQEDGPHPSTLKLLPPAPGPR